MSGVIVIRHLLANSSAVLAVVPAARIVAGDLPVNTELPAITISQVSSVPYNLIRTNETNKLHTDRVQVAALFKDQRGTPQGAGWTGLDALLKLVLAACPSQRGSVNGVSVENIVPAEEGPDLTVPGMQVITRTRDFFVKWVGA